MDLNYNTVSLIDTLGFVQGIILGTLLLFINREKRRSTTFLGLFILAYGLELLPGILERIGFVALYPSFTMLPLAFHWLLFPLFYIYVQRISIFSNEKVSYWVLYPGLLYWGFQWIVFYLPIADRIAIEESLWFVLLNLAGILYTLWIGVLTIRWIYLHKKEIGNQYATVTSKELKWAKTYVVIGIAMTVFAMSTMLFFDPLPYQELIFSTINVLLLYWVSLRGMLQYNIVSVFSQNVEEYDTFKKNLEVKKGAVGKNEMIQLLNELDHYIRDTATFKKPDLTIVDVSEALKVHPRRLSTALNSIYHKNFNSYINTFRVAEAKTLLQSETTDHLSVEGIGLESGFNSKSSFYAVFKKEVGCSPARFKKQRHRI